MVRAKIECAVNGKSENRLCCDFSVAVKFMFNPVMFLFPANTRH